MVLHKTILILEDNLSAVSKIIGNLALVEQDQVYELSIITLTNSEQVKEYINDNPKAYYDIVILDRDCKLGGSFHVLDIERFGPEKVISISSVPEYNEHAKQRGVKRTILKDYKKLDHFSEEVTKEVIEMLRLMPLTEATPHYIEPPTTD